MAHHHAVANGKNCDSETFGESAIVKNGSHHILSVFFFRGNTLRIIPFDVHHGIGILGKCKAFENRTSTIALPAVNIGSDAPQGLPESSDFYVFTGRIGSDVNFTFVVINEIRIGCYRIPGANRLQVLTVDKNSVVVEPVQGREFLLFFAVPPVLRLARKKRFPACYPKLVTYFTPVFGYACSVENGFFIAVRLNCNTLIQKQITRSVDTSAHDNGIARLCPLNGSADSSRFVNCFSIGFGLSFGRNVVNGARHFW